MVHFTSTSIRGKRHLVVFDDDEESKKPTAKQKFLTPAVSEFGGEKYLLDRQKRYLQGMWHDLRNKIMATPVDSLSSIRDDVSLVLDAMKQCDKFNFSIIESLLASLFDKADSFDEARKESSEKATKDARQLAETEDRLREAKMNEDTMSNRIKSTQAELDRITKELRHLRKKTKTLSWLLKQQQESLQSAKAKVTSTQEEILAINNAPPLDEEAVENLKTLKSDLEATQDQLESVNPFA